MEKLKEIEPIIDLTDPKLYLNRELSFIEFNKRVLNEADNENHPLLERLKFISIFSSNVDEFFMIRVAGLKSQIAADVVELSYDGRTPKEQLAEIRKRLVPLYEKQKEILYNKIIPALRKENVHIHDFVDLNDKDKEFLKEYFCKKVLPVLTPLSLDPGHPFPRIINRSLNIAFSLKDPEIKFAERKITFLQLPPFLERFVRLDRPKGYHLVLMEQIVKAFAETLFPGLIIETSNDFRITRDADFAIAEDEADDLMSEIAEQIKQRRWGRAVVRLEVSALMPDYLVNLLIQSLDVDQSDVYVHDRPLHMPDFMRLLSIDVRHLKDKPFATRPLREFLPDGTNLFEAVSAGDLMVYHPFDSFTNNTLKFINQSVDDPDVMAIKITLYRTGMNSPVVAALKKAAENGKEVTAFVELKARFDEENNITWAKELERTGVHVVYGVIGLKTHCKICLVIRKEADRLRTYLHLSTGNYNQQTARIYTDFGYFTVRNEFEMEAIHLFNYLTGYSKPKDWNHFSVGPINLYQNLLELIENEIKLHTPENPGLIFAKMNSLAHRDVIPALYRASQKGVRIKLIVRGICCLKPALKGVSENIEVRSIIGRFLEHSRAFYFKNGGKEKIFLSSADWMSRNLHKRVELMFPIYDEKLKKRIWDNLNLYWRDNTKSWKLLPDGSYSPVKPENGDTLFNVQEYFLDEIKHTRDYSV